MTIGAIAGLTLFNVLLAVLGTSILFALRSASTRHDLLRLVGLSYLLGVAALMIALTLLIVVNVPVTFLSTALVAAGIFGVAWRLGRRRQGLASPAPAGGSGRSLSILSAAMLALVVVSLESIFRKGRLQGLLEFDGWDAWGPRAKALYHFGQLDPHFLDTLPGGSYPPGVTALLASALHATGSADVVTVHLQYWFLGIGFVGALLGLLAARVTLLLLLPFVLLVFVMPDIRSRSADMYGDLPLGFLIATAALLMALWLHDRLAWRLPVIGLLLAAAVLTKREGVLLACCVVFAGTVASLDRIRQVWRGLVAVFLAVILAGVPWQIWLWAYGLPGNGPEDGPRFLTDLGRGWDSFVVVTQNLFDFNLWLLSMTVALAAVGLCLLARAWRIAAYFASVILVAVLSCTVIIWSDPNIQLTDVNVVSRLVGTVALIAVAISPLALQRAWEADETEHDRTFRKTPVWRVALAWALVAGAAIAYPATLMADGGARFPQASDCIKPPVARGAVLVVFGHVGSYPEALRVRARAIVLRAGTVETAQDGCGKVRVFVDSRSEGAAQAVLRRAKAMGISARLEAPASS